LSEVGTFTGKYDFYAIPTLIEMVQKKYFRKITIKSDLYGVVSLPKEAVESFLAKGYGHVEMFWDSQSDTLTLRAI